MRFQLRNPRLWLGIVISIICLWLAARGISIDSFISYLSQVNYFWLIPALVGLLLSLIFRGLRWSVLLEGKISTTDGFWAFCIGNLFNNILPLRAGDGIRVLILSEKSHIPLAQVAATVVVERFMDIVMILVLLAGILPFFQVPSFAIQSGIIFTVAVICGLLMLILMTRYADTSKNILEWILRHVKILPSSIIIDRWQEIIIGFQSMIRLRTAVQVVLISMLTWATVVWFYYCVLLAFGATSPVIEAILVVVVISLAISLPSSPGYIGVFQLAGQQALVQPFGNTYSDSQALGIILVAYLTVYIATSALGGLGSLYFGTAYLNRLKLGKNIASS